jgi:hypothetical protein
MVGWRVEGNKLAEILQQVPFHQPQRSEHLGWPLRCPDNKIFVIHTIECKSDTLKTYSCISPTRYGLIYAIFRELFTKISNLLK